MRKGSFKFAVAVLGLSVMLAGQLAEYAAAQTQPAGAATQTQVPQPQDNNVNWPGAGYGVGALFCNVLYIPAKLVYALFGGIIGGGTYLATAGNSQAANTVWRSSLGGDYVLTPEMVSGEAPIHFSGPTDTAPTNGGVQPITGASPMATPATSYAAPAAPAAASSPSAGAAGGAQPMDRGSGSTGGSGPPSSLPDTSIE